MVIIFEIFLQSPVTLQSVFGREQVDVLVLDAAPEALDENIVQGPSLTVHAEPYGLFLCHVFGKPDGGELAPMVGVEHLRCAMLSDRRAQGLFAPFRCHGVRQRPADHIGAVQVDNGTEVEIPTLYGHIGDVHRPYLSSPFDVEVLQ
mgnify:CR=1 FL=1